MGLAFLPWEKLPAYVLGPLFCAFNLFFFFSADERMLWHVVAEAAGFVFGLWMIWYRCAKGVEPLWSEEQRRKHAQKKNDAS